MPRRMRSAPQRTHGSAAGVYSARLVRTYAGTLQEPQPTQYFKRPSEMVHQQVCSARYARLPLHPHPHPYTHTLFSSSQPAAHPTACLLPLTVCRGLDPVKVKKGNGWDFAYVTFRSDAAVSVFLSFPLHSFLLSCFLAILLSCRTAMEYVGQFASTTHAQQNHELDNLLFLVLFMCGYVALFVSEMVMLP